MSDHATIKNKNVMKTSSVEIRENRIIFFNKEGWHGYDVVWYNDNQKYLKSNSKNGRTHGERKWWNSDVELFSHKLFKGGELIKQYL